MKPNIRKVFRIFYRVFFALIFLCTVAVLIITPADAIQQALRNRQPYNVFVIAGTYFITFVLAALIWSTRWWTNKQALKAIPKSYIPVEKGDVNKKVRKMIVAGLNRSAVIAWDARPRLQNESDTVVSAPHNRDSFALAIKEDDSRDQPKAKKEKKKKKKSRSEKSNHVVTIPPEKPVWGDISHDGWSSPTSHDLPNLQYVTVILELPHLIEARAVSLAPPDPDMPTDPPTLDVRAASFLQRPASMGLRDYMGHLTSIGVVTSSELATDFLAAYEYARFSGRALSENEFRELMKQFAELLREMKTLAPSVLEQLEMEDDESDIDRESASAYTSQSHRSASNASLRSMDSRASQGTVQTAPSREIATEQTPTRGYKFSTAPATPVTPRSRIPNPSRSPSSNLFSRSRQAYAGSTGSSASSLRSTSQGSVIRLSRKDEGNHLPYALTMHDSRSSM